MKGFEKAKQHRSPRRFKFAGYDELGWYESPRVPCCRLDDWRYDHRQWNEKKATKVLNKILPSKLEWVPQKNAFYYDMDREPYGLVRNAPFYYKKWVEKFRYDLHYFVRDGYQNVNYIKTVIDEYGQRVKFEEKT